MGTVPVPYSPVAGDDATQARVLTWADALAYLLGSATSGGSKKAFCVMRQTVAQTLTTATNTAITFDTEDVDYDNGHSTVTNTTRYTAATAGWHFVRGVVAYAANAVGERDIRFRLNGLTFVNSTDGAIQAASTAAVTTNMHGSCHVFMNVGDYIELLGFQSSGGNLNTQAGAGPSSSGMSVAWWSN